MSHDAALSRFLSYILRHAPEHVGLTLDAEGWVSIEELLVKCRAAGRASDFAALRDVVTTSPKQRFAISLDGQRIRANQGHSIAVDLGYPPVVPPAILFHGTYNDALARILVEGLQKMQRHHVHLSADIKTAIQVGGRRGTPVLLRIDAAAMHNAGLTFSQSDNGVWLTEHVPIEYLSLESSA